jgi:hypothetical protein
MVEIDERKAKRYQDINLENARRYGREAWWLMRDGVDDWTGQKDLVIPLNTVIELCPRHALSVPNIDRLSQRGDVYLSPNPNGFLKCAICGRAEPVMYSIRLRWVSYKVAWYVLGGQKRRLSVDGDRIV